MSAFFKRIKAMFTAYPAGPAWVIGVIVTLGSRWFPGLHLTITEVSVIGAAMVTIITSFLHYTTVPRARAARLLRQPPVAR